VTVAVSVERHTLTPRLLQCQLHLTVVSFDRGETSPRPTSRSSTAETKSVPACRRWGRNNREV